MANRISDLTREVIIFEPEAQFSTDPDPAEALGGSPLLLYPSRKNDFPFTRGQELLRQRVKADYIGELASIPAGASVGIAYEIEMQLAQSAVGAPNAPSGGRLLALLKHGWGTGHGALYGTLSGGTASTPIHTGAAAAGLQVNDICAFHDADGGIFDVRMLTAVSGNNLTPNRQLSFTPSNLDPVVPLYTFTPHDEAIAQLVPTSTQKLRGRPGSLDGFAANHRGCAVKLGLSGLSPREALMLTVNGLGDDWSEETPQDLALDALRAIVKPPVSVGGRLYWNDTVSIHAWDIQFTLGDELTPYDSNNGLQGRAGFSRSFPSDTTVSFTTTWRDDLEEMLKHSNAGTERQYFELLIGKNGRGAALADDKDYMAIFMKTVEMTELKEARRGNERVASVTLRMLSTIARQGATAADYAPCAIGLAGRL